MFSSVIPFLFSGWIAAVCHPSHAGPVLLPPGPEEQDSLTVSFPEFSLTFVDVYAYEEGEERNAGEADTLHLTLQLGADFEAKSFFISGNTLTHLTIEERYRTSMTVAREGPHCDLLHWKHGWISWKPLPSGGHNSWVTRKPADSDRRLFPAVSIADRQAAIRDHCGDDWSEWSSKAKSVHEYPCHVGISEFYIRVRGLLQPGNKPVTRIIVLHQPMGC